MAEYIGDIKIDPDDPVVVDEDYNGQEIYDYQTYFNLEDEMYTEEQEEDFLEMWLKGQSLDYLKKLTNEQIDNSDLKDILINSLMNENKEEVLALAGAWKVSGE